MVAQHLGHPQPRQHHQHDARVGDGDGERDVAARQPDHPQPERRVAESGARPPPDHPTAISNAATRPSRRARRLGSGARDREHGWWRPVELRCHHAVKRSDRVRQRCRSRHGGRAPVIALTRRCDPAAFAGRRQISNTGVVKSELGTREAVARLLMEQGPVTAAAVAAALQLSGPAVRRHLDALIADGEAEVRAASRRVRRGRGRPAKLYLLTDAGRARFGHGYDDLAVAALRYLAEHAGRGRGAGFRRAPGRGAAGRRRQGEGRGGRRPRRTGRRARRCPHRPRLRGADARGGRGRAAVPTSLPGRRTSPPSSRRCARPRRRRSPSCWAPTCSGSPPSPAATRRAPPTFHWMFPSTIPRGRQSV